MPEFLAKTEVPASDRMTSLEILSKEIPLPERIMHIALDPWYRKDCFSAQLQQARDHLEKYIDAFLLNP